MDELETLRAIWEVWPGTRDSDLDFFASTIRSRGTACRPYVIVLTRNARPEAMLVGLRERRKMPINLGYFTICCPEVNVLEFVYGGLRGNVSEENCAAFVSKVMCFLEEGDADLALWQQLDVRSSLYTCAVQLPRFAFRDHSGCLDDHWFMNFPKGQDAFFTRLSRSQRSKLQRKYKKVLSHFGGRAQVRSFCSLADLELTIADMEEVASKTDKRWAFATGFVDTPQMRAQMAAAAERGWLRIYILYFEDKPAAFWMGTLYDRCLQADHVGYDPVWRRYSPGIFLFLNILDYVRGSDIRMVDFGYGSNQLRECFGDLRRTESRIHVYAPTLRGVQLNLLCTVTHRVTNCAKFLLRRIHCLERVKRAMREGLANRRHHGSVRGQRDSGAGRAAAHAGEDSGYKA